jgi:hypothetical protein
MRGADMKYQFLLTLPCLAFILFSTAAASAPDLAGTWIGKTEVPDQGTDEVTLVLKKDEKGYTGTVVDTLGLIAKDTEIMDVKVEGNEISFRFPLTDGAMISVKMTADGNKMAGAWVHPEGDTGVLSFEKKKQ